MQFTSTRTLDDGVLERDFTLGDIPGVLWTPEAAPPAPLILSAHNGGLHKREDRLVARSRYYVAECGFAVAAIDAPGSGDRPRSTADEQVRRELREAMAAGDPVDEIFEAMIVPLVERAVPEWQQTLDALLALPEIGGPVAYAGMAAIGIRLVAIEPRIAAALYFGGGYVPRAVREDARQIAVPVQFLMQWDDEGNERQDALDVFDALGAEEKTLHANLGGHSGTPWFEVESGGRFFARHLR